MNATILMLMETSTPFLNYYLFFRSRYPFSPDVNLAKSIFGMLFLLFRMILNTWGAYILINAYIFGPAAPMPEDLPQAEQYLMVAVILAGAGLQMFWGVKIIQAML